MASKSGSCLGSSEDQAKFIVPLGAITKADLLETPLNPINSSYKTPYSFETILLKSLKRVKLRFSCLDMTSWVKGLSTLMPKTFAFRAS